MRNLLELVHCTRTTSDRPCPWPHLTPLHASTAPPFHLPTPTPLPPFRPANSCRHDALLPTLFRLCPRCLYCARPDDSAASLAQARRSAAGAAAGGPPARPGSGGGGRRPPPAAAHDRGAGAGGGGQPWWRRRRRRGAQDPRAAAGRHPAVGATAGARGGVRGGHPRAAVWGFALVSTPVVVFLALSLELLTARCLLCRCDLCALLPVSVCVCSSHPPATLTAGRTWCCLSRSAFHSSCWSPALLATFLAGPRCY